MGVTLAACKDSDFEWMLGKRRLAGRLRLPPGGVDVPATLAVVRKLTEQMARLGVGGTWMIVRDDEVVGLCGYKGAPVDGSIEIGFSIAIVRRRRGYASSAVGELLKIAGQDPAIATIVAETEAKNVASQRVLSKNGFTQHGTKMTSADGPIIIWSRQLGAT